MIPGIVAGQMRGVATAVQRAIFPLTYDEQDSTGAVTLTRSGGYGPHITPAGFEGDGYSARYTAPAPAWTNSGPLTLAASVTLPLTMLGSAREEIVSLCTDDAAATRRLGLSVITDPRSAAVGAVAVSSAGNQQLIGRPGWRYEFRSPIISEGSYTAKPQAVLFLDGDTVLFSVHLDDTESRVYKVRLSDGALLGEFTFGTVTHRHVASFARRSNGDVWAGDYDTSALLRLDLDASFASGTAQILQTVDASELPGFGAIEFATLGDTEYLLSAQYSTADAGAYLYLHDAAQLAGSAITVAGRHRRWLLGRRLQGIAMRAGKLLAARNAVYGSTLVGGVIEQYDLDGMLQALTDGAVVSASVYLLGSWSAPSAYPEDLAVNPSTGAVATPTEGAYAVADATGFLALWSSPLDYAGVCNDYAIEYNGAGQVLVRINGREWGALSWAPTTAAAVLTIGGLPQAAPGFDRGYSWATVANVLLQQGSPSAAEYAALFAGEHELQQLTAYPLTLTNAGAELGDTSGWTVESGGMTVRSSNPLPFEGAFYFTGGSFASSVSRQRLDLAAQGVPVAALDAGTAWAKIRWKQAAYGPNDPGGMGLRTLTAGDGTLATQYSGLAWTLGGPNAAPGGPWFPRSLPVALLATARKVDALYNASGRTSGTANDCYVDAIDVMVYAP